MIYASSKPPVTIDLRIASFFSFFNSPYPGHRHATAIDIYFNDDTALFPIDEGRVIEIRWFGAPKKRPDGWDREPLIIVEVGPGIAAKIMHVLPSVRIGEKIYYGDPIGRIIVSGFLYIWSEKHMHLEIRPLHDRYRARGAYRLKILVPPNIPSTDIIYGTVEYVEDYYILLKPLILRTQAPTPMFIRLNGYEYVIEGGYPHYGYLALLSPTIRQMRWAEDIIDLGSLMASIIPRRSWFWLMDLENKFSFSGISTYFGRRLLKLISYNRIRGLKPGDTIMIDCSVMLKCIN